MEPTVSIIIPAWRDGANVRRALEELGRIDALAEIIIVDVAGESELEFPAVENRMKLLHCATPSRGGQMNLGAAAATSDVLIFQHADTEFRREHFRAVENAMRDAAIVGGAFYRKFDERHPHLFWLEGFARNLTRNGGTLFGDQTVFVRREIFERLGGFAQIPLMEDVEFSRRLRAAGRVVILDPPVQTSARKHVNRAWRTTIQNGLFLLLFKLGVSPQRLHAWYYATNAPPQLEPAPAVQPKQ